MVVRTLGASVVFIGCGFSVPNGPPDASVNIPGPDDADTDPPIDAALAKPDAPVDAPGFSLDQCPSKYEYSLTTASGSSKYYADLAATTTFWAQHADCKNDLPGRTHMIVIDSTEEAEVIKGVLVAAGLGATRFYVGVVQDPAATSPTAGWVNITGGSVAPGLWGVFSQEPQPSDDDNVEIGQASTLHEEQVAVFDAVVAYLYDAPGTNGHRMICECDGKPVTHQAEQYMDDDPRNPNP